jgi:hypothetical protein
MEEIKRVEYFDDRYYKIERKNVPPDYYPSVTTKLGVVEKPFLAKWRGDIGNREADMRVFEAQERGSRIHAGWEAMTLGGAAIFNPSKHPNFTDEEIADLKTRYNGVLEVIRYQEEMYQLMKLQRFLEVVKPKIIASELTAYSDKYREAGTIDNVFEVEEGDYFINGRSPLHLSSGVYIGDLKTGSMFDDNAYMQMAAYASMYAERHGVEPVGTLGIHTGAKTKTGIPGLGCYHRTKTEWKQDFQDFRAVSALWERKHKDDRPETFEIPTLITIGGIANEAAQTSR